MSEDGAILTPRHGPPVFGEESRLDAGESVERGENCDRRIEGTRRICRPKAGVGRFPSSPDAAGVGCVGVQPAVLCSSGTGRREQADLEPVRRGFTASPTSESLLRAFDSREYLPPCSPVVEGTGDSVAVLWSLAQPFGDPPRSLTSEDRPSFRRTRHGLCSCQSQGPRVPSTSSHVASQPAHLACPPDIEPT